jgi:hypothetical protein
MAVLEEIAVSKLKSVAEGYNRRPAFRDGETFLDVNRVVKGSGFGSRPR